MLKTKVEPTMCMKTKRERQNVMPKMRHSARKCCDYTVINNSRADLLSEDTQVLGDKSGHREIQEGNLNRRVFGTPRAHTE